jgi:hypothetical protein
VLALGFLGTAVIAESTSNCHQPLVAMEAYLSLTLPCHSEPLSPQGLFISSINSKAPKTPSNTWHHHDPSLTNLSRF